MAENDNQAVDQQVDQTAGDAPSEAEVREAASMGWADKDKWRGNPDDWVDAKHFLEKAQHVLPIVRSHNDRLKQDLAARDQQIAQLAEQQRQTTAALRALEESNEEQVELQRTETVAEVKAQIAAASRDGDHERVAELTEKLVDLKTPVPPKRDAGDTGDNRQASQIKILPEVQDWMNAHPEYKEGRRAVLGAQIMHELKQAGNRNTGVALLEDVAAEVEKFLGGNPGGGASKVSGGNGGNGRLNGDSSGPRQKGYQELPSDAKQTCDRMSERFVGKKYKDAAAWRNAYAKQYWAQEGV